MRIRAGGSTSGGDFAARIAGSTANDWSHYFIRVSSRGQAKRLVPVPCPVKFAGEVGGSHTIGTGSECTVVDNHYHCVVCNHVAPRKERAKAHFAAHQRDGKKGQ